MWAYIGGAVLLGGFLVWWYRQGGKGMLLKVFKDEQKKSRKIQKDWDEIDADRKKQRDQIDGDPGHDPGGRWE